LVRAQIQRRAAVANSRPRPYFAGNFRHKGLGGGDAAHLVSDRVMDAVEICQDLVVPEPQDAIAFVLQEPTSLGLPRRRVIVLTAVDFHDQPGLVAHKISNVAADRQLAAELLSLHLMRAHDLPDPPFRFAHVLP
jgi:hypothetical protein